MDFDKKYMNLEFKKLLGWTVFFAAIGLLFWYPSWWPWLAVQVGNNGSTIAGYLLGLWGIVATIRLGTTLVGELRSSDNRNIILQKRNEIFKSFLILRTHLSAYPAYRTKLSVLPNSLALAAELREAQNVVNEGTFFSVVFQMTGVHHLGLKPEAIASFTQKVQALTDIIINNANFDPTADLDTLTEELNIFLRQ